MSASDTHLVVFSARLKHDLVIYLFFFTKYIGKQKRSLKVISDLTNNKNSVCLKNIDQL